MNLPSATLGIFMVKGRAIRESGTVCVRTVQGAIRQEHTLWRFDRLIQPKHPVYFVLEVFWMYWPAMITG